MLCIKNIILYAYIHENHVYQNFYTMVEEVTCCRKKCVNVNLYIEWKVYKHELVYEIKSV